MIHWKVFRLMPRYQCAATVSYNGNGRFVTPNYQIESEHLFNAAFFALYANVVLSMCKMISRLSTPIKDQQD